MISFNKADANYALKNRTALKAFIGDIFKAEKTKLAQLDYVFCSDSYLLTINQQALQHDYFTDIITFNLTEDLKQGVVGEVYISIDRVKDNAQSLSVSYTEELLRVIFHGALHLCGYNDKTKKDISVMRAKEDFYIKAYQG